MPLELHGLKSADIHAKVRSLIHDLVNIKDETGEFLMTLADGRIIDTKGWNDWEWTHGVGLYGIWKYYELTDDAEFLKIIEDWFQNRFDEGHKGKNINTMAVFLTLAFVYEKTGNQTYVPWLDSWAEWAMHDLGRTKYGGMQHTTYLEINDEQLWDDTLMMTVMPLAKIGLVLNRPEYVAEAKRQFLLHTQYLFDAPSGLFFHGWTFPAAGHHFARARWARGNAWLTIVIPEFVELSTCPRTTRCATTSSTPLEAQAAALVPLQEADGSGARCSTSPRTRAPTSRPARRPASPTASSRPSARGTSARSTRPRPSRPSTLVIDNISPRASCSHVVRHGMGTTAALQGHSEDEHAYGQAMAMMALVEFLRVYY
ncbi:glycosyl hydrolase [Verticillium alfalfae VaMs.102]|uniref:Glycosyl hydrolase n=1 Tax=Verticillium alfalfae (strain VaMs.102 / ATCC MYA-4576 / FGSC 10136) TaxID=526221 RepID=C9S9S1_VERA1|nr:glycosyl hydrolase [Verticillium alfalfae VaMs.102]EEY16134.1 glycosyl hydrolase [Verticillium alfalfae VaMs.102]